MTEESLYFLSLSLQGLTLNVTVQRDEPEIMGKGITLKSVGLVSLGLHKVV